jgi:hypothetical protein
VEITKNSDVKIQTAMVRNPIVFFKWVPLAELIIPGGVIAFSGKEDQNCVF